MEIYAAILGAIIGGFLAAASGVALYIYQQSRNKKSLRMLFITAIRDDLSNSISLYEKIKSIGKSQKFIPFEATNGLRKSRQIYEKYTEHLLLIESFEFRKRIFDYYLQSSALIDKLESYQNRVYAIQSGYSETLRRVKEENPYYSDHEIRQRTLKLNESEANEFIWLKNETLEQLNNLDTLKIEAQLILDKLEKK